MKTYADFEAIKHAVSIVLLLDCYGISGRFRRGGDSFSGSCAIHDGPDLMQFGISISKKCWTCSSEGKRGDTYAAKYIPIGYRTPSLEELGIRRIAQDLKLPTEEAIVVAAPVMAALIDGACWLVPVPASTGSLTANLALARAIAALVPSARVKCAIGRAHAVESCCQRRMRGLPGLTVDQHAIIRTAGPMQALPVYFVDNVITTGTTAAACVRAFGWGNGLAYADASTRRNARRSRPEIPAP